MVMIDLQETCAKWFVNVKSFNALAESITGLGSLPFSTIIKAQRNLRATRDGSDSSHGSDHESTRTSRDRVSQVKAKLAEMQQRKGKAVRLPHKVEEAETPEAAERETLGREHKHA